MTISAPSVSAKLRAAGFGIVATRNREGIRVSRGIGGRVSVCVDLDRPGEARRTAALLEEWLGQYARTLGWQWSKAEGAIGIYTLSPIQPLTPPAAARAAHPSNGLVARAVADMEAGKVVSFNTEPVLVAKKPLPKEQATRLQRDSESGKLAAEVTTSATRLRQAIYNGTTPAQADITAARTALEALIALAGGDQPSAPWVDLPAGQAEANHSAKERGGLL